MALELFLGPVVSVTISKVISLATEQINLGVEYEEELDSFCTTLNMVKDLLFDAEQKQGASAVKTWLKKLREIADEADAVMNEIAYENLRPKVAAGKPKTKQFECRAKEDNINMGKKRSKMYRASHRILLVGEGDFSFSLCLARRFGSALNMVATSLDSRENVIRKYTKARENLQELEDLGCRILHGIDAHTMSRRGSSLHGEEFDRIVFNFPHAGFHHSESSPRQIGLHQHLVRGFLENAIQLLAAGGQVFITHKTAHPFNNWGIVDLADQVGLDLISEVPFYLYHYPGYQNKKGHGSNCNKTFPVGECSTFRFKMSEDDNNIDFRMSNLSIRD